LAIVGRGQQAFDQLLISVRRWVVDECIHLLRCWKESDEVKRGTPDQSIPIRLQSGDQALFVQGFLDEGVNRVGTPAVILYLGNGVTDWFLKSPPLAVFFCYRSFVVLVAVAPSRRDFALSFRIEQAWSAALGLGRIARFPLGALIDPSL